MRHSAWRSKHFYIKGKNKVRASKLQTGLPRLNSILEYTANQAEKEKLLTPKNSDMPNISKAMTDYHDIVEKIGMLSTIQEFGIKTALKGRVGKERDFVLNFKDKPDDYLEAELEKLTILYYEISKPLLPD